VVNVIFILELLHQHLLALKFGFESIDEAKHLN